MKTMEEIINNSNSNNKGMVFRRNSRMMVWRIIAITEIIDYS
jgi:hypothetical protein